MTSRPLSLRVYAGLFVLFVSSFAVQGACVIGNAHPCKTTADCATKLVCYQEWCVPSWFPAEFGASDGSNNNGGSDRSQVELSGEGGSLDRSAEGQNPDNRDAATQPETPTDAKSEPGPERNEATPEPPSDQQRDTATPDASAACGQASCQPGQVCPCYRDTEDGCKKDGTACVGSCKAGQKFCILDNGTARWSSCFEMVLPKAEECNGQDDDCDGKVDNIKGSSDPLSKECYAGPAGTKGVGACTAGKETCQGGQWSACAGEVTPQPETCNKADTDCNGKTDDLKDFILPTGVGQFAAMTSDAQGNVYISGNFAGTTVLGGKSYTAQGADTFIMKLDQHNNVQWVAIIGGLGAEIVIQMALDSKGNLHAVGAVNPGTSANKATFSPSANQPIEFPLIATRGFIAKLDPHGKFSQVIVDQSLEVGSTSFVTSIRVGPQDELYTAGHFKKKAIFSGKSLTDNANASVFVLKWDPGMQQIAWALPINASKSRNGAVVELTTSQLFLRKQPAALYITGSIRGVVGTVGGNYDTQDKYQFYVGALSPLSSAPSLQWVVGVGGTDSTTSFSAGAQGVLQGDKLYMGGHFVGKEMNFPNKTIPSQATLEQEGDGSPFLSRFDVTKKSFDWVVAPTLQGASTACSIYGISLQNNTLSVTGRFLASTKMQWGSANLASNTKTAFIGLSDTAGKLGKAYQATGNKQQSGLFINLNPQGNTGKILGRTTGDLGLGTRTLKFTQPGYFLSSLSLTDGWICP